MGFDEETIAERQATALRARMVTFAADYAAPLPAGDAGLGEAWRRYVEIDRRFTEEGLGKKFDGLDLDVSEEIIGGAIGLLQDELREFIDATAPRTMAGALVKLRRLIDRESLDEDPEALAIIAAIERIAAEAGILNIPSLPREPAPLTPKPKIAGKVAEHLFVALHGRSASISDRETLSLAAGVMRLVADCRWAE